MTPFPGTPIYKKLENKKRILTKDWSKYNLKNVVFKPKNMTETELMNGLKKVYKMLYSTPNTVKRISRSLNYGFYPFFFTLARTSVANMARKKIKY